MRIIAKLFFLIAAIADIILLSFVLAKTIMFPEIKVPINNGIIISGIVMIIALLCFAITEIIAKRK